MPIAYRRGMDGKIAAAPIEYGRDGEGMLWLDALNPDDGELAELERIAGFAVPNKRDMTEIELSNRLYKEEGALVMIASLLPKSESRALAPRPATFILKEDLLLTIRYCEFFSFERVAAALLKNAEQFTPLTLFCRLLEEAVSDRADSLEYSMRHMEILTSQMFSSSGPDLKNGTPDHPDLGEVLRGIGGMGERVSNIRESITSLQRVLNFAKGHIPENRQGELGGIMDSLKNDLAALSDEASFLMNKLSFNLDAALGMINIDETKVIRVLSVATLLLAPPTLIAGIYGMNFDIMPELKWPFGYLFSLSLMAATAGAAVWWLKRKRWF